MTTSDAHRQQIPDVVPEAPVLPIGTRHWPDDGVIAARTPGVGEKTETCSSQIMVMAGNVGAKVCRLRALLDPR